MAVSVLIATILRKYTSGQEQVNAEGRTVREVIDNLQQHYQGITSNLFQESGELKPFVNVYVNDEDIRFLNDLDSRVSAGDTITILPAIAGG
jgi:molybdopterin synthase sulfur carrier subunit